ncbi:hypothetical protein N7492_004856 [Penicillium capsulatum]|uniref:Isoprenoid synthase domain-containing protein n=1 Tax=Penicillium capsulatum TaxID=69766 RepID=A0A9W9IAV3_9EURO|nr:hypothetical protein N7492_004856 [Penicillium capsulatum]KAJ6136035.1 hypothetical protein N7512_001195 [Penicillium capsulatum]
MNRVLTTQSVKEELSLPIDHEHQFPIHYAYDYLNGGMAYLKLPVLRLNDYLSSTQFLRIGCNISSGPETQLPERGPNAIDISPSKAGLPWATGILFCRQNKYWQLTLDTTRLFLALFAADESAQKMVKSDHSVAEISRKELRYNMEEGWVKFPTYLYTEGDPQRTRLLAIMNVFVFVFDDFWEMHETSSFVSIQQEFISRMNPDFDNGDKPRTTLQSMIDHAIQEIIELDHKYGNNAGQEMIDLMIRFFTRPPPPAKYNDMEEFLLYRHEDAALLFVLGCAKFALNSSVDFDSPHISRYLRLIKDHLAVANDLGSWEKEKRAYDTGKVLYLINAVDVVKNLFHLPSDRAAISMTEALQLQIEVDIDAEIQRMIDGDALTAEEWRFIDATLYVMSGNVFVSTVMSRYGGETYRLA